MMLLLSAVYLISQLTVYSKAMETEHTILALGGATIRLKCTGSSEMYYRRQWRVPVDTFKDVLYYDGTKRNPSINLTNVNLEVDNATRNYDLVIFNLTTQNLGVYKCILANSTSGHDGPVSMKRFRVLIGSTEDDAILSSTYTSTGIQSERQIRNKKTPVLLIVGLGFFVLSMIVATVLARQYFSRILHTKWNAAVSFCFPKEAGDAESAENEGTEKSGAFQNRSYHSTHLNVEQRDPRIQIIETNSNRMSTDQSQSQGGAFQNRSYHSTHLNVEQRDPRIQIIETNSNRMSTDQSQSQENQDNQTVSSGIGQNTNDNRTNNGRFQISDRGLNYSEVLHETGPSNRFREIRGTANRTIYAEIDHSLTALPLPVVNESDNNSDED